MKRNRRTIETDGKEGGDFLIPSNDYKKRLLWLSILQWQNKLLPVPLKHELQNTVVFLYSTEALGCASMEKILT